jgi:hypothetical protein
MRAARALGQARDLVRATHAASRAHRASPVEVVRRARSLRVHGGFEYAEALGLGLLDPALGERERSRQVSRHATVEAQARLNPAGVTPISGEKAIFYPYCAVAGIPTPRLFGIVDSAGVGWNHLLDAPIGPGGLEDFLARDLPGEFVVKPSGGYHGKGVRALRREGGLLTGAGWSGTPGALAALIRDDAEFPVWVAQERLHDHPALARLVGGDTLQTLRVVTLVADDGSVEILYAVLRLAIGGGDSDNFLRGTSGNAVSEVRVADGRLGPLTLARPDGCGFERRTAVPGSGVRVDGAELPLWESVVALVRESAPALLPARTIGWDIAVTPAGPLVIEANMFARMLPIDDPAAALARMWQAAAPFAARPRDVGRSSPAAGGAVAAAARRARRIRARAAGGPAAAGDGAGPATLADALNPEALASLTADGTIFHRYFAAHGVRVPALYGAIGRAGGWSAVSGWPLPDAASTGDFLAHQVPGALVIAPSGGGPGTRVLQREGGVFHDRDGGRWEVPTLVAAILSDPGDDLHIVRERLVNHAGLARLAGTADLATVRVTTFASRNGRLEIAHAALSQKGVAAREIDVATGVVAGYGRLPDWEAAAALAREAGRHMLPQRSIGFDIALTPGGPVLMGADRGHRGSGEDFAGAVRDMARADREGRPLGRPQPGRHTGRPGWA